MKWYIETERLILRDLLPEDAEDMLRLDSNPEVHRYLGNNPVRELSEIESVIAYVQKQYDERGIGRWATIEKSSGAFIGWTGLKRITEPDEYRAPYTDVGYRLMPEYWGKGYATEATLKALWYGFTHLDESYIVGTVHGENKASRKVLEKCGLTFEEHYLWNEIKCDWLSLSKESWLQKTV